MAEELDITTDIAVDQDAAGSVDTGSAVTVVDDGKDDIRSLLNKAMKVEPSEGDAGQPRGPDGKFAPKSPEGEQVQDQSAVAPQGQQSAPDPKAQAEQLISKLPAELQPEVRQLLETRDTAFNNWAQNVTNQLRGYEAIGQIIGPRVQGWAMNGTTPEAAINQLFALSDFAGRDPAQFVQWFAGQHNIDLATVAAEAPYVDPEVQQLRQQVQQLQQNFQGYTGQQTQQQMQAQEQQLVQQVENFAAEKSADGKPLRPYFAEVANDIMTLMPGIQRADPNGSPQSWLNKAYETATWANPVVRAKVLEQQRITDAAQKVNRARTAGSSVIGGPAGEAQRTDAEPGTVREALEAAMAQQR